MQVVKIPGEEADDVVATLVEQVLEMGYRVAIASPDKDFKQLICQDVQLVMPLPDLKRWSFYTLNHYIAQYKCDPLSDLSLSKYTLSRDDLNHEFKLSNLSEDLERLISCFLLCYF